MYNRYHARDDDQDRGDNNDDDPEHTMPRGGTIGDAIARTVQARLEGKCSQKEWKNRKIARDSSARPGV